MGQTSLKLKAVLPSLLSTADYSCAYINVLGSQLLFLSFSFSLFNCTVSIKVFAKDPDGGPRKLEAARKVVEGKHLRSFLGGRQVMCAMM